MILVSLFASRNQKLNNSASCKSARHEQVSLCHCGNETGQLGDFCADSPFSLKVAAVLWFSWSGRDETCISSGGSPRSGEARGLDDRQLGSEGFADTRPASQFDMGNGSVWMFLVSMLHAFKIFQMLSCVSTELRQHCFRTGASGEPSRGRNTCWNLRNS